MLYNVFPARLTHSFTDTPIDSCEEFAARDCIVYATARRLETLKDLQSPIIKPHVLNVTSNENVEALVKTTIDTEGRIDLLVNNAGVMYAGE